MEEDKSLGNQNKSLFGQLGTSEKYKKFSKPFLYFFIITVILVGGVLGFRFYQERLNGKLIPAPTPSVLPTPEPEIDSSCQTDSDCTIKRIGCSECCGGQLSCVNKDFIEPICPSEDRCLDCALPRPHYCFCEERKCIGEQEKLNLFISNQDIDRALEFCSQYMFGMHTQKDKVGNCKAHLAEELLDKNYAKAIELCKESVGYCGYELAQSIAKKGHKENALSICHQYKYQKTLCYKYIAFEIAKYDYEYALPICENLEERWAYEECVREVQRFSPSK